jgi:hypothetical protein
MTEGRTLRPSSYTALYRQDLYREENARRDPAEQNPFNDVITGAVPRL